jgi:hypothetical protein
MTFGELKIGEHFIFADLTQENRVWRKIYPVESGRIPGLYYTAQENLTGVILPFDDDKKVIVVVIQEYGSRPLVSPAKAELASGVSQKGRKFYEMYEKRFGVKP